MNLTTNGTNGTTQTSAIYLPTLADTLQMPLDARTAKAITLVEEGRVTIMDALNAKVKSASNNRKFYTVTNETCSCKDSEHRASEHGCCHARAVRLQRALTQFQAAQPEDAPRWSDYDAADDAEEDTNEAWAEHMRSIDKPFSPFDKAMAKQQECNRASAQPARHVPAQERPPEAPATQPVESSSSMKEHTPSWRDHLAPIIHTMSWRDNATGVSHSVNLRADIWEDLIPDIQTISEVAKKQIQASMPTPAAQPEAPASQPTAVPESKPEAASDPGWCRMHQIEMRRHEKNGDVWYSHKDMATDTWCKGKDK